MTNEKAMLKLEFLRGTLLGDKRLEIVPNEENIEMIDKAMEALEKQIPKKMNLDYYCGFKSCECPECGYTINLSKKNNYCNNCGQRLE